MKIRDAFKEVRMGINLKSSKLQGEGDEILCYTFRKNALDYGLLLDDKLIEMNLYGEIEPKYFMQGRDIIISVKKPYKVVTYPYNTNLKIIIPSNFIILRDINMDKYSFIFVINYLNYIAMDKYFKDKTSDLTIEEINDIELPDIPKVRQMKISGLMNNINKRGQLYSKLIKNDKEIIFYALNKIVGDNNV